MEGTDFNLATSILFVGYLLMQLSSNLLLTRVRPSLFLRVDFRLSGSHPVLFGAHCDKVLPRICRGAFLSWCRYADYTRQELSHRIAWFYSGSSLANAFGGLIGAGVLGNLDGVHGIAGWRWVFIIEGSITVGKSLLAGIFLPNYPASTPWLDEEEQAYAQWRLMHDAGEADEVGSTSIREALCLVFADKRIYLFILLQHVSLLSQNLQYFFPTIVQTLEYSNIETLLITAPVWIATFFGLPAGDMDFCVVGCVIVTATTNIGAKFLMPMGAVSAYQIIIAWVANSFPRPLVKRSAAIAVANMIGNTASIYGSYMWPSSSGPRYIPGGSATAAIELLVALVAIVIRRVHIQMNKWLDESDSFQDSQSNPNELESRAIGFQYIL
ncbi:hypothetical protein N7475_000078 [Penicillium sp. IBT 31633x]|nr:hypothetical protein N7475_000078 [Penicillium sp. IBT 31633x]